MKTLLAVVGIAVITAFSGPAHAGPGDGCHFHGSRPAAESVVIKCANERKESLVKGGKLDTSWSPIKHDSVAMIDGKKTKEWRVVYTNSAAADKAKTSLYIFFTPAGNFIAANHTGQ